MFFHHASSGAMHNPIASVELARCGSDRLSVLERGHGIYINLWSTRVFDDDVRHVCDTYFGQTQIRKLFGQGASATHS